METDQLPWAPLSRHLGELLRPHLTSVTAELLTRIQAEVPDYARPLEGSFGNGIRRGVEVALARFLELPGTTDRGLGQAREVYLALGGGELRQGRSLTTLLAAYRVGARVACRRFTLLAQQEGVPAEQLLGLAEAIFVYIDEISAASAEGYAAEQSARAGTRDRLRRELLEVLLAGGGDPATVAAAAAAAGWSLPARISVVIVPAPGYDELAVRLWPDGLVGRLDASTIAVVPVGVGSEAALEAAIGPRFAVVGPERGWREAPESLRLAQFLLVALPEPRPGPVHVSANLVPLLLHREPALLADLGERVLAPMAALRDSPRRRLEETLLSWLVHRGERVRVAAQLHIHPQTVGYRLTQLRGLFGAALEDPQERFSLELVLRARSVTWT